MTDAVRLVASTDEHEGYRSIPYRDTRGLWTFGKGRCLETNPLTRAELVYLLDGSHLAISISQKGADWLMRKELQSAEAACKKSLPFWAALNDARQNALIEMAYQMGFDKLLGFKKMLAAIERQDWLTAEREALDSDWFRQTPKRAQSTAKQICTGEFQ
jgi:lysozyme